MTSQPKHQICQKIAHIICRFCERWSFALSETGRTFRDIVVNMAVDHEFPGRKICLPMVGHAATAKAGGVSVTAVIRIIDPVTGKDENTQLTLDIETFGSIERAIPPVPENVTFGRHDRAKSKDRIIHPDSSCSASSP
jgi:hypothetical protein